MKTVHKTVLIWYSAQQMFDLVTDVPSYPSFLPWCSDAQVLEQHAGGMTARISIALAGLQQSFTTRNVHGSLAKGGQSITLSLVEGPFSKLQGAWSFTPVGEGGAQGCHVELQLNYDFASHALAALVGPVFDKIAGSLVDAFVKRAEKVYGEA
jgi:ribosome-associated toxin RatA of RatAB toxin-antitoxin module